MNQKERVLHHLHQGNDHLPRRILYAWDNSDCCPDI